MLNVTLPNSLKPQNLDKRVQGQDLSVLTADDTERSAAVPHRDEVTSSMLLYALLNAELRLRYNVKDFVIECKKNTEQACKEPVFP